MVDLDEVLLIIRPLNPHHALVVVDLRDEVEKDASAVLEAALQVVDEVVVGNVAFHLARADGDAGGFIRTGTEARVIDAGRRLHVVGRDLRLLRERGRYL